MNKLRLSEELGLSLVTISRYISMGMPYEKEHGQYHFDLEEVQDWIDRNIDRRQTSHYEGKTSIKEIAKWGLNFSEALFTFIEKHTCDKCRNKFMQRIESGKFHT